VRQLGRSQGGSGEVRREGGREGGREGREGIEKDC
jgi:hypothetical protein